MSTVEAISDGRIARGVRTREAILEAYEQLIRELGGPPTGSELATRAGVSPRSVFTHFGDMDGVLAAASSRAVEWIIATHVEIPLEGEIGERLLAFTARQAATLERTVPLYRALMAARRGAGNERCSVQVRETLSGVDLLRRNYIMHLFGQELLAAGESRDALMEALVATTSWNVWEGLRSEQGLPYERALEVMRLGLSGLFGVRPAG